MVYQIDCSDCEEVYFGESKQSLKSCSDEHKKSVRNCDYDKKKLQNIFGKQITTLAGIPRKFKETMHSLKNRNHINKIS